MGQLGDRMEQDLKLRGLSPAIIRNYVLYCRHFAAFFMRSPEEPGAAEVRAFLLHQIEVEQLAYCQLPPGVRRPEVPLQRQPSVRPHE